MDTQPSSEQLKALQKPHPALQQGAVLHERGWQRAGWLLCLHNCPPLLLSCRKPDAPQAQDMTFGPQTCQVLCLMQPLNP